jgi:hypothetical protein
MCPLCLTSLAVTVTTTTGAGATVIAAATRIARALRSPSTDGATPSTLPPTARPAGGER